MTTEVDALKVKIDKDKRLTERYFEWAQQKYPFEYDVHQHASGRATTADDSALPSAAGTKSATIASPTVEQQLDMRGRFLCTPPVHVKVPQSDRNAIMSSHLPWLFEENTTTDGVAVKTALPDASCRMFNKPATPMRQPTGLHPSSSLQLADRQNTSLRSGGGAATFGSALDILARVRDRCDAKADNQWRSSSNAITTNASMHNTLLVSPSMEALRATAVTMRTPQTQHVLQHPAGTTSSASKLATTTTTSSAQSSMSRQYSTMLPQMTADDTIVVHESSITTTTTNRVIHLHTAGSGIGNGTKPSAAAFVRTSPSGRFVLAGDLASDASPLPSSHALRSLPMLGVEEHYPPSAEETVAVTSASPHNTPTAQHPQPGHSSASSSDVSLAVTARKIIFSPDSSDDDSNVAANRIEEQPAIATDALKAKRLSLHRLFAGEESLSDISDTVLQDITM